MDNPKNENHSSIGLRSRVVGTPSQASGENKKGEDPKKESENKVVVEGDVANNKNEGEKSEIESNDEVKGWTLDQIIDKNSPCRRTEKYILNDPNPVFPNIKAPYPFLKKKLEKKDEK